MNNNLLGDNLYLIFNSLIVLFPNSSLISNKDTYTNKWQLMFHVK